MARPGVSVATFLLVLAQGGATFADGTLPSKPAFFLGGIQVNEPDHGRWMRSLEAAGMNTVAVTVYARQGDWDSDNLWWDEDDSWVVREVREAKAARLRVALVVRVALDHAFRRNHFLWHGMIMPRSEALLDGWFERYGTFVRRWASVAAREGIDLLAVGSELNALASTVPLTEPAALEAYYLDRAKQAELRDRILGHAGEIPPAALWSAGRGRDPSLDGFLDARSEADRRWAEAVGGGEAGETLAEVNRRRASLERRWRQLIAAVRTVYRGPVGYAANFDQYREVGFWDALDFMGVNAYFSLRTLADDAATPAAQEVLFTQRWREILGRIDGFRAGIGLPDLPLVFTELGYSWRANSTLEPWQGSGFSVLPAPEGSRLFVWGEQPPDPGERARAVRALYRAARAGPPGLLRGILYWKLSTVPEQRGIEPFVLVIGDGDPLEPELSRFVSGQSLPPLPASPPAPPPSSASPP